MNSAANVLLLRAADAPIERQIDAPPPKYSVLGMLPERTLRRLIEHECADALALYRQFFFVRKQ